MKEFKAVKEPKVCRSYEDMDLVAFAAKPDLRKVPMVIRKYVKSRIMALRAAKWNDRAISTALGIKHRAVTRAMYAYEHFDVLYEDMRTGNEGRPSRFDYQQLCTITSPQELEKSAGLTLIERAKRLREVHQINVSYTHLRNLYRKVGVSFRNVDAHMTNKL